MENNGYKSRNALAAVTSDEHIIPPEQSTVINNAKGILILCVVVGHIVEIAYAHDEIRSLPVIYTLVLSFEMQAFMIISGYLSRHSQKSEIERSVKFLTYYIVIQFLFWIIECVYGDHKLLLRLDRPYPGAWYLLYLFWCNIIIYCVKSWNPKKVLLIFSIISIIRGFDETLTNRAGLVRVFSMFIFFAIGYFFYMELPQKRTIKLVAAITFVGIDTVLAYLVYKRYATYTLFYNSQTYSTLYPDSALSGMMWQTAASLCAAILCVAFFMIVPSNEGILTTIGENSLYIYLAHILIMRKVYNGFYHREFIKSMQHRTIMTSLYTLLTVIIFIVLVLKINNYIVKRQNKESILND